MAILAGWGAATSGDANLRHDIVGLDLLHDVEARGDLAEHRVHPVEVLRIRLAEHHEELATAGILACVRHGERAHRVLVRIPLGLALDGPSRATSAHARVTISQLLGQRITALHLSLI